MAFTVFYTVQISDVATKIFEAAGGKAVVTNHFFDEAGYIEELKALKPEAIMCRTEPITAAMMDAAGPNLKVIGKQQPQKERSAWYTHRARMPSPLLSRPHS